MYNNYFFLNRVCEEISEYWQNSKICASFSQNKNELIIECTSESYPFLKMDLSPSFSCISFQEKFSRARKNTIDIFPELINKKILKVEAIKYDRSFTIFLEQNIKLIVQLHGSRSNAILINHNSTLVSFKKSMLNNVELAPRITEIPSKSQYLESNGNLRKLFPVLGSDILNDLENKSNSLDEKWKFFARTVNSLNNANKYCVKLGKGENNLGLLIDSEYLELRNRPDVFDSAIETLNIFYREQSRLLYLKAKKKAALQGLKTEHKRVQSMLAKQKKRLNFLKESTDSDYKKIEDILMANMHAIKPNLKLVTLLDFEGNPINIKLDPSKSVITIAENYYRKSKKQHIEVSSLSAAISSLEDRSALLNHSIEEVENVTKIDELPELLSKNKNKKAPNLFHEYIFNDYKIYVGKNAKNNDILTFEFGTKNDLWLHAKDEKGSHIIIKQIPGMGFSEGVIEYAAKLAAINSKRKTDSLVPVMFTERKYVRKKKGFPPGAVVVERENVILVKPELPNT